MDQPKISLIAALSENRVIGNKGEIPWRIPGEQKRFKEITTPHPMIMGRKTFESIGRVLPGRPHIIVSRDQQYSVEGATVVDSLDKALEVGRETEESRIKNQELSKGNENSEKEVFIIGGGQIFEQAIGLADKLYLTIVHKTIEGDAFFPDYSAFQKVVIKEEKETEDGLKYTYLDLEK